MLDSSKTHLIFEKLRQFYKGIDLKIAAVERQDQWFALYTETRPLFEKPSPVEGIMIEVKGFCVLHKSVGKNEIDGLLEKSIDLDFSIRKRKVSFQSASDKPQWLYDNYYNGYSDRANQDFQLAFPLHVFHLNGHGIADVDWETINSRLVRHRPRPYRKVEDVLEELFCYPKRIMANITDRSESLILISDVLAIRDCVLEFDQLSLEFMVHENLEKERIELSVIPSNLGNERRIISLENVTFEREGKFLIGKKVIELEGQEERLELSLFTESLKDTIDRRTCKNKKMTVNPRYMAHFAVDKKDELLKHLKEDAGIEFEERVCSLLHIAGLNAEFVGYLGDSPDIIAFYQKDSILIVAECKAKVPDEDSFSKLRKRAKEIAVQTKVREVYPVMITNLAEPKPTGISHFAAKENLNMIFMSDLEKILELAEQGKTDEVLNLLISYGTSIT